MSLTFAYRARTPSGAGVRGTMRAIDRRSVLAALRERMLVPSRVEPAGPSFSLARLLGATRTSERLTFFRAFAALEGSGVDFSTSFELLIAQTRSARMREALEAVAGGVERRGEKLWEAMSRRPDDFSDLECAMVAAGEEAGNRQELFERLASLLERDSRLRKRVAGALFYPALVALVAIAVAGYLVFGAIPQFAGLFAGFGVAPPAAFVVISALAQPLASPFAIVSAAAFAACAALLASRSARSPSGALALDGCRLRLPVLGDVVRKATVARLCRALATLLQSGVDQLRALDVAAGVVASPVYARALAAARDRIANGTAASFDEALDAGAFPPLLLGFLRVGAASGTIPALLARAADYFEDDVEAVLAVLPATLGTVVTIALGAVVAGLAYTVYAPLAALGSSIR